jgi:demethylmenaquinone methyltransferase/2-methoxy-6-polyprenyl-1,4-benzoquinol methylase
MSEEKTHFGYQSISTTQKTERVSEVFQSVAPHYDIMNDLMSFGLHRIWKRIAVARCMLRPNDSILDLAGGTGDLTQLFAKQLGKNGKIVLTDINEAMVTKGRQKLIDSGIVQPVSFALANAEALPFHNNSFDRIIIAFGLRNITFKELALQEMFRVLKPGGRVVILEFSEVQSKPLSKLYDAYSFSVLPLLGKWISKDEESYRYLAESIRMHPNQEALKSMMEQAGFEHCEYQNLHSGIVTIHIGHKF